MANLSGTITFPQGGSSYKTIQGRINWEETEIDSSSSPVRSKVHTKIYAKCGTGGTTGKGWNGYVQVGSNSKHSFSSLSSSTTISSSYVLLKEYDDWVEHEADGSKTVTIKGKVAGPSGTSLEGVSSSGSGDATLTNVPQASTITSVSNGTTPYSPTIVWTPASTSFKYKVEYKYTSGGSTWSVLSDLISPATTSSYSYNSLQISDSIFRLSPNSPTLTATAVLYTYNSDGTTQVGNVSTKTFTVTLNSSIKPTLTVSNLAEADSDMIAKNWGVFVQGKSKLSFHLGWTYPSPVPASSTLTATTNGQTFTTTSMSGSADYTTSALSSSGSKSVSASITDSRGRTTNASASYTVYEYSKPFITNAVAERCLQNGALSDTGTYLKYSFASTISSCNGHNTATYQLGYRVKGSNSAYTYVNISNNATNVVLSGVTFSASNSYDIQFRVTDAFNEVVWEDESIGSGFRLVHYNKNKKAIAIGKSSEVTGDNKLLEIAMPTYATENIETTKSLRIPKSGTAGYGLCNSDGVSIIRDHNNSNITIDATGGGIFFGYDTTNYIDFFRGLAYINNAGGFGAKTIQQQLVSNGTGGTSGVYVKLCNMTFGFHNQGEFANFRIYIGDGNNGYDNQNAFIDLTMQLGWTGSNDGRLGCNFELHPLNTTFDLDNVNIIVIANSNINYDIYLWTNKYYCRPNYTYDCSSNVIITNDGSTSTTYPSGTQCLCKGIMSGYSNYSSTETITGYIEGKPIYSKIITGSTSTSSNSVSINHNISNLNEVISYNGWWKSGNERRFIPQFYYDMNSQYSFMLYTVNDTQLQFYYGNWVKETQRDFKVIINYTKTTD